MTSLAEAAPPLSSRRQLMLGGGLVATAALAGVLTPRRHEQRLAGEDLPNIVPNRLGLWLDAGTQGLVLPQNQAPVSVYDRVLTREYVGPGLPTIMLLIAYGTAQSGLMQVHRPEVCYQSAGFQIDQDRGTAVRSGQLRAIPSKTFTARREQRIEQVLYWTRISDQFPISLFQQRLIMLQRGLRGVVPDGLLVRISTLGPNVASSQSVLHQFAGLLVQGAGARSRSFFAGRN